MTIQTYPAGICIALLLLACGPEDGDEAGGEASTETNAATEDGDGDSSGDGDGDGDGDPSGDGDGDGDVCGSCAADEYCHESIIDGPSEFECRAIPGECEMDATCDCIVPVVCPESLQACMDGEIVLVECVEG